MNTCAEVREWITVIVAIIAFVLGLFQYRRAQKWRRMEWIAAEVKAFFGGPHVKNALLILDWKRCELPYLRESSDSAREKTFMYEEDMLGSALETRSDPSNASPELPFSSKEVEMRDCMDRLLDGLGQFEIFIRSDLIKQEELHPFIGYWTDILSNPNNQQKSPEARRWIRQYAEDYRFDDAIALLRRFKNHCR
jgi:hypothetical protein